jgi:transcriptional regulator with XRE-family HTH domain
VADSDKPALLTFLSINGLKESDLKLVPFQYDPTPLIDGQMDGFVGYSTQDPITLKEGGHKAAIMMYADYGYKTVTQTYVATADFGRDVGAAIRRRRRELGMTSKELAAQAGVSAPFITQVELGRSSVSLPRLYRIAEILGVTPNSLLPVSSASFLVTRAGAGQEMRAAHRDDAQRSRLLTRGGPGIALKAHHYLIDPSDPEQDWFRHHGEDLVYVIRGQLVVEFEHGRQTELGAGDALHHDGEIPHRWVHVGESPTEVLIVNDVHI